MSTSPVKRTSVDNAGPAFEVENPLAEDAGMTGSMVDMEDTIAELETRLAAKTERIQRMKRMQALDGQEVMEAYKEVVYKKDMELETIRREMYMDSKAHPQKKQRTAIGNIIKEIALSDGLHESPNTVQTIINLERRNEEQDGTDEDPVRFVWALVFDMPAQKGGKKGEGKGEDEEEEEEADPATRSELPISHEAWMACEQIVTADLCLRHAIPVHGKQLIIAIGAPHHILVDEATEMKLLMRMQESKGAMEFHEDLMHYYCSNHGGLNEFCSAPPEDEAGNPILGYGDGSPNLPENYHEGYHLRPRDPLSLDEHWKHTEELDLPAQAIRKKQNEQVFTSAIAQRLVMNRLQRQGRYNPDHHIQLADSHKTPDMKALNRVMHRSVMRHRDIPASMMHDMLTLFGGYRPANQAVFPTSRGQAVVSHCAKMVQNDDQFILKPTGFDSHKFATGAEAPLSYDQVVETVAILERWKAGKGREEVWFGTLSSYFPLHQESELVYLKKEWGNPKMLFRKSIVGYNPEAEPSEGGREMNTFGACGKERADHRFPMSLVYQPLEEIRDYFGDDVGLYFSWLGTYTRGLFVMSSLGFMVMIYQPIAGADSGCDFFGCGVSHNPFTIFYSIYVGIWSTIFIESWHRRENELRFLWGSESLSQIEQPRPQFVGELHTNPETGRQVLEVKSPAMQYVKIILTTCASIAFILFTIASAVAAQMVRYIDVGMCVGTIAHQAVMVNGTDVAEGVDCHAAVEAGEFKLSQCDLTVGCEYVSPTSIWEQKKFEITSSVLNLTIIGVYGFLFEALADILTEWENHRTQSEFDNSRVGKNFLFQFVNNYFVLFYIAYLREVEDPISKAAHPCHEGNCLPELQMQLIIVFSGKTMGKQIAYTMKPFIFKWKAQCQANSMTKSLMKASAKGTAMLPVAMQEAIVQIGDVAENATGASDPRGQMKELKKIKNPYEMQARLMPYDGTFADFNDRVIQFGYLVLFAPAFPLAPFLAFVNNVIEIRTSGFKMCFAYQRPKWRARAGIGSWLAVLNVLGFLAVITNATMITFVGDQDAKARMLCPISTTTGDEFPSDAVCPEGDTCTYGCNGLLRRSEQWHLWFQFAVTEHCVLLLRVIILALAPSMPKWILDAREVLEYRQDHRYRTSEDIAEEKRLKEEYAAKMKDGFSVLKHQLWYKTEDELRDTFYETDPDHSGQIDDRELKSFFAALAVSLSDEDIALVMKDIDEGGDNSIDFDEMLHWLIKEDLWDPERAAGGGRTSPTASPRAGRAFEDEDNEE